MKRGFSAPSKRLLGSVGLALALFVADSLVAETSSPILQPLPVRGEFLLTAGYLSPSPSSTRVLSDRRWAVEARLTLANTFAVSESLSESLRKAEGPSLWQPDQLRQLSDVFVIDGETQRATVLIRRGLPHGELFLSLPAITMAAWSDSFIESFHADFHLGSDGRSSVLKGQHFIYLKNSEHELIRNSEGASGLGDITVGAKFPLRSFGSVAFAAEALVELPTGDEEVFFGSGSTDVALNLLASRGGERSNLFASAGVALVGGNAGLGVPSKTTITTTLGFSREILSGIAATIQMTTANSPYDGSAWPELAKRFFQWSIGLQQLLDSGQVVHLALIENAVHYENSADLAVQLGISIAFP